MGFGRAFKKITKKITSGVIRGGLAAVTGGMSELGGSHSLGKTVSNISNKGTDLVGSGLEELTGEAAKERQKAKTAAAAQAQAEQAAADKAAADRYKASILGQRQQRLEDALSSQTDFTGDEEEDPRKLVDRTDISKRKKLIGF